MEQRQPMFHAGVAPAFADGVIEDIIGRRRPECRDVSQAEAPDRFARQLEFGNRHEIERAQLIRGALAFWIEAADGLQRVAEKIEPDRLRHARRIEIDDASSHRVVARLAHRRCAHEAIELKPLGDVVHGEHLAGRNRQALPRNEVPRRHALKRGIDRGEQNRRPDGISCARKPRQRHHALREEPWMRRNPVIGQTVPRRKLLHGEIGCKKIERTGERGHARAVPANNYQAGCRSVPPRSHSTGQVGKDEAFSAVGDAC